MARPGQARPLLYRNVLFKTQWNLHNCKEGQVLVKGGEGGGGG